MEAVLAFEYIIDVGLVLGPVVVQFCGYQADVLGTQDQCAVKHPAEAAQVRYVGVHHGLIVDKKSSIQPVLSKLLPNFLYLLPAY